MIRIVFIITGLSRGGAEVMLYKLIGGLDRTFFDPIVISLMHKDTRVGRLIEGLGVNVHTLGMHRSQISLTALWRLIRLVHSLQPDIIQGCMYHGNLAASVSGLLSKPRVPVFWSIHNTPYNLKDENRGTALIIRLGRLFASWTEKIIYVSKEAAFRHEMLGYPSNRSTMIPNGFDCNEFKPSTSARLDLHRSLRVMKQDILIGLIGRYHPMKDHANFFKAAGILSKKHNHVQFVLAGLNVDAQNKELSELILRNELSARVHLLGVRDDMPELTAGLDIASSSSFSEAFPLAVGEAMACGVPCVVTDVGDSAWIVGETGKVVPPRNAKALAKAWELLINAGPEERIRLGNEGRQRLLKNFTLDQIVRKYESLYKRTSK